MRQNPSSSPKFDCKWKDCTSHAFYTEKDLWDHVITIHVGSDNKNVGGNVTRCHWDDCLKEVTAKRHHLTSHVKIHLTYKPYFCHCGKTFKRSHDKNKHIKMVHNLNKPKKKAQKQAQTDATDQGAVAQETQQSAQPESSEELPIQDHNVNNNDSEQPLTQEDNIPVNGASVSSIVKDLGNNRPIPQYVVPIDPALTLDPYNAAESVEGQATAQNDDAFLYNYFSGDYLPMQNNPNSV